MCFEERCARKELYECPAEIWLTVYRRFPVAQNEALHHRSCLSNSELIPSTNSSQRSQKPGFRLP
eukprot:5462730-Pyramimonas_sp.AAC.1